MYGARMVAHGGQLSGLVVGWVDDIVDGCCGPDADKAIYQYACQSWNQFHRFAEHFVTSSSRDKPRSIWRNVTAVNLEILLLSTMG